jgi:hypothetical protein
VLRYFSGQLLDASSFQLEQQYLIGTPAHPHRAASVWLELDEGDGFEGWHERNSLTDCDPDGRCFLLDRAAALILFGDGINGRRPMPSARVRGFYRTGSAAAGNVPGSPAISRADLVSLLAEVSHLTWMRQKARDKGLCYTQHDPTPTDHDRERAHETIAELERIGLLHPQHQRLSDA